MADRLIIRLKFAEILLSVGVSRTFVTVCLSVCQQHNLKTNDPIVFKLGVGNGLEMY